MPTAGERRQPRLPRPARRIRAGLAVARHPWLLVLPCDAPRIDRALLETLLQAAGRTPARPWMLRCGGQWEPLFSLIPTHLAEEIEHAWRQATVAHATSCCRLARRPSSWPRAIRGWPT